jgi:hypothetical protein
MLQSSIDEYIRMVKRAFEDKGGLEGQRDALKTNTAIRIRSRMIQDIALGAVLPPIVLGAIVPVQDFETIKELNDNAAFLEFIHNQQENNIYIIDGMQRTKALIEALKDAPKIADNKIRLEYWIASDINSLTYRMLVLNTGQVPWNIRRQIEIVFQIIIKEIEQKIPDIDIMKGDEGRRRANAGQFQANNIVELYLVFGARKEKIDIQERLAEEFTRLDFIESTSNPDFTNIFYEVIDYLVRFDRFFSYYQGRNDVEEYFKEGKDLFSSQPACVGFVTAIALSVLGRPGSDYIPEKQNQKWNDIKAKADQLLKRLETLDSEDIGKFLDFETLQEIISKKPGKASYFEREFFLQAFKVLIEENFDIENMTQCWRAY